MLDAEGPESSASFQDSRIKVARIIRDYVFDNWSGGVPADYVKSRFVSYNKMGVNLDYQFEKLTDKEVGIYYSIIEDSIRKGYIESDSDFESKLAVYSLTKSGREYFNKVICGGEEESKEVAVKQVSDVKKIIQEELEKDQPDWNFVERLSRLEVNSDVGMVRFSVDAGHIQRLGFELVAKQETALTELIKNSYDSDATQVHVSFSVGQQEAGTLVVDDNGSGMELDIIKESWMRISTDYKKENTRSTLYGRQRSGRKGIGRFAVQRLGHALELKTEVAGNENGVKVNFNWNDFQSGNDISDVFNKVEFYNKPKGRHGTVLTITGLREQWSQAQIKRVWKNIFLLQSPFEPKEVSNEIDSDYRKDIGFNVTINQYSAVEFREELSIQSTFLDHALAEISGHVDAYGKATVFLNSKRLAHVEPLVLEKEYLKVGSFSFSMKYFIYSSDVMAGVSTRLAAEVGQEYGGIRIYRNGFRVLPYGERYDDWLSLDKNSAKRVILAPAANTNFFGEVLLSSINNPLIEETSSREGLLENDAFQEIVSIVYAGIDWAVGRIAFLRGRKQKASQLDFVPRPKATDVMGELKGLVQRTLSNESLSNDQKIKIISEKLNQAELEVDQYQVEVESEKQASIAYQEMLRILASLGVSVAVFGHEIKGTQTALSLGFKNLINMLNKSENHPIKDSLLLSVADTQEAAQRMLNLGGYIDRINSSNQSRKLSSLKLDESIRKFFDQFSSYLFKQSVELILDLPDIANRTVPMHASEIDSVLLNFMTNSVKSIKKSRKSPRRIKVTLREVDFGMLSIKFEDTGVGVQDEEKNKIFDAFYTTSINDGEDFFEGTGTGLGLKIVHDIALGYGGAVHVAQPSVGFSMCIDFRVPAASGGR
jgi:signal transduction histidine kinase/DNA-binding PadR family transcriptional regulator